MPGESESRGNDDPKPQKPAGDDPRSGVETRSLIHSDMPKRKNGIAKAKH
ncbi:hypothetical protein GCM10009798_13080 [Nocardioides panacihumi]|uniref:Uncharacterized protein n=1 Tax=Nocardioides panacihumi TaxID=400774 RepID=A0ABN2QNF8_9ACTN